MNSIITYYLSWKPFSSENCNHPSITSALVLTEHLNFSHCSPIQLLYFLFAPFFTHIVPTTYTSIAITITVYTHFHANCNNYHANCTHYLANSTYKNLDYSLPRSAPQLLIITHWRTSRRIVVSDGRDDSTKWLDRTYFLCPRYFFPHLFSSSYLLPLFHYLISILLFPCAGVWENTRAWVPSFR